MARSHWKGVISFGLVSIPIVLYPAENKKADIHFHQIDKRDNARIKYKRINVDTEKEVPWEQIARGYEYDKETTIPVPDELLKRVAGDNARSVDIETFINKSDLNLLIVERTYYLVPDKNGEKGYVILRDALNETKKVGIAKVIISTKEYLAAVMPYEDALVLCLLKYADEIRPMSDLNLPKNDLRSYKINKKEIEVAKQLINSMSSKWNYKKYEDDYQKALHKWVANEVKHLPTKPMKQRVHGKDTRIINFVDLLKQSLATTKGKKAKSTIAAKAHRLEKTKYKIPKHAVRH